MPANQATKECHRLNAAKMAARRPTHALNDREVEVVPGATALSAYKNGSNYISGVVLLVVAVVDGKAIVAGPQGLAMIPVTDLTIAL